MGGEWTEVCLDDLVSRRNQGVNTTTEKVNYSASGVVVIRANNISPGNIDFTNVTFVDADTFGRIKDPCKPKQGDVLYTNIGSQFGTAAIVKGSKPFLIAWNVLRLQPNDNIDAVFLTYLLNEPSNRSRIIGLNSSSTMPFVSGKEIGNVRFSTPPLDEQRAIAHILGTLDDKIDLNRQMNETLEAMARAIFKSWFVDFDPVRAKMEGRKPFGTDAETAALFPDGYQDSALGKIPKGWEVRSLDKIASYLNGLALQKFPPNGDDSLPVIKIAQLRADHTQNADRAGTNLPPQYIIKDGDVLFSWSGSLEVEIWCGGRGALNQHLFKVTSAQFPKWFYYLWTLHHLSDFQDIASDKATTMGHIQRRHLTEATVLVPPPKLLEVMNRHFAPLIDKLIANRVESRTLAALRDTLLPKLLSGEVRVKDV